MLIRGFRCSALASVLLLVACSGGGDDSAIKVGPDGELKGVLKIDQGVCGELGPVSGSWFRMIPPDVDPASGEFVTNFDSQCADQTYSLLSPGKVGLRLGDYQASPKPPFDAATNGVADEIIQPTRFFSVTFALSSEKTSPLTGSTLPAPRVFVTSDAEPGGSGDASLTASLESLYVAWNGDWFEQGSPHPEGYIGFTTVPRGTINLKTGRFVLDWISEVDGGAFDETTGQWHLEGTFVPE